MKKKTATQMEQLVTCDKFAHKKSYLVEEAKEKPGYAICPACGDYHRVKTVR
jgi:hypothetical protein